VRSGVKQGTGVLATIVVIAVAVALVQLAPRIATAFRADFPPFVMTIEEWNSVRVAYSDGRTVTGTYVYRLEYRRRDEWSLILVSDDLAAASVPPQGSACRNGTYGQLSAHGDFTATSTDPGMCNGVGRWIHYGIARAYPWTKELTDGLIIYTDPGERVVFDSATGLPELYEAGITTGAARYRMVFRVERWL